MRIEDPKCCRNCESFTEEKSGPGSHMGECLHEKRNTIPRDEEQIRFLPVFQPGNPARCAFFRPEKKKLASVQTILDF